MFNFSDREQDFRLKLEGVQTLQVLLDSGAPYRETGGGARLPLPPEGVELRLKPYCALYYIAV